MPGAPQPPYLIVHDVALVYETNEGGHTDLDDDASVHLGGTGNHVLYEVHMAGAINVTVVTSGGPLTRRQRAPLPSFDA